MSLEEALYARLAGDAALGALVGERIFPVMAPQDTVYPYVIFFRGGTGNLGHLGGRGTHDQVRLSVVVIGQDAPSIRPIAVAVRKCLDGYGSDGVLQSARLADRQQAYLPESLEHTETLEFSILAAE